MIKLKKKICDELGLNNIYVYNRLLKQNEVKMFMIISINISDII